MASVDAQPLIINHHQQLRLSMSGSSFIPDASDIRSGNCPGIETYLAGNNRGVNDCGLYQSRPYFWVGGSAEEYGNRCAPLGQHYIDKGGCCYNLVRCIATAGWDTDAMTRGEDVCQSKRSWERNESNFELLDVWMGASAPSFVRNDTVGWSNVAQLTPLTPENSGMKGETRFECEYGCFGTPPTLCYAHLCSQHDGNPIQCVTHSSKHPVRDGSLECAYINGKCVVFDEVVASDKESREQACVNEIFPRKCEKLQCKYRRDGCYDNQTAQVCYPESVPCRQRPPPEIWPDP